MGGMKEKFYKIFEKRMDRKGANNQVFTKERYEQLVSDINDIKNVRRKNEARDYSLSKRYCVMQISNIDKLIYPVVEGNTGHGG